MKQKCNSSRNRITKLRNLFFKQKTKLFPSTLDYLAPLIFAGRKLDESVLLARKYAPASIEAFSFQKQWFGEQEAVIEIFFLQYDAVLRD